jgi:hypothetical protein
MNSKTQSDNLKYSYQQCQDDLLNQKFRVLHKQIVNAIIQFCKENDIMIDEIHLNADCLEDSIKAGSWQSCTDSCFRLDKTYYGNVEKPYLISL